MWKNLSKRSLLQSHTGKILTALAEPENVELVRSTVRLADIVSGFNLTGTAGCMLAALHL